MEEIKTPNTPVTLQRVKSSDSLIEGMFEVGAHYGHSKSRRHPSFAPYVFGVKEGIDVINLEKTSLCLSKALGFLQESVRDGKTVLFVGTKPEVRSIVEKTALSVSAPYVTHRWIGGLITNFSEIKKRVKTLEDLLLKRERGELDVYTKVERMAIEEEIEELTSNFGGITTIHKIPDVIFVVDPRHEAIAVAEAKKKNIPVVALIGSDGDLQHIDYPIPANDAKIESVSFFMEKVADAYKKGEAEQKTTSEDKKEDVKSKKEE